MKKLIRDVLKEAGRYEDVTGILINIINDDKKRGLYPVSAHITGSKVSFSVDVELVKREAADLLKYIVDAEDRLTPKPLISVYNLFNYVHSESNAKLHNYAVHLSHNATPLVSMDTIRNWEILDNLIICLDLENQWYIPDGWKAT